MAGAPDAIIRILVLQTSPDSLPLRAVAQAAGEDWWPARLPHPPHIATGPLRRRVGTYPRTITKGTAKHSTGRPGQPTTACLSLTASLPLDPRRTGRTDWGRVKRHADVSILTTLDQGPMPKLNLHRRQPVQCGPLPPLSARLCKPARRNRTPSSAWSVPVRPQAGARAVQQGIASRIALSPPPPRSATQRGGCR